MGNLLQPKLTDFIPCAPTPKQAAFLLLNCRDAFYGGSAGGGKALCIDTPIPTPDGWTKMGDIRVGDQVLSDTGIPCNVIWISDIHTEDTFRVIFSDGSKIIAGSNHQWVTSTICERSRNCRNAEFRKKRREKRPSRGTGKRPDLVLKNLYKSEPEALPRNGIRTTKEIYETLRVGKRINHAIAVSPSLELEEKELLIDPYVLGAWLGDGTSSSGAISGEDEEVFLNVANAGYHISVYSSKFSRGVIGLQPQLKSIGVFKNKHIPISYLRSSKNQRLSLLQGLMDTDGHCDTRGQCEITLTRKQLAEDVHQLILSLGIKCSINESEAKLNGEYISQRYRMKFITSEKVFRMPRKLIRQKRNGFRGTHENRYIVNIEKIERVPLKCIQVDAPSHCYLAGKTMIPTHNSQALLMAALQYVDIPSYAALLLRDSYTNLTMPGALLDRADEWLSETDAKWDDSAKTWRFPSGATLTFGYLDGPRDHLKYKSAEFQFVGIDEASDLRWKQINYLFSRLRRLKGVEIPIRFRLASNPGGISHDELKSKYINKETRQEDVIFIPAGLDDNPHLDRDEYVKSLNNLDPITRAQLLDGDWNIREGGRMFKSHWFKIAETAPVEVEAAVRYWDLAATEEKKVEDSKGGPAFTSGVKMVRTKDNVCYIVSIVRGRFSPRQVEATVRQCADIDGHNVHIWMEQEPGSGGVNTIDNYTRNVLPGFIFKGDKVGKSKATRAMPLASYAEAGNVYLVNGAWVKDFLDEAEMFPDGKFKDQMDSVSGAFNKLFAEAFTEPKIRIL